ncbi:MAG: hypothetical protein AAFR44_17450, partial [Pseudomonadota bacterium]
DAAGELGPWWDANVERLAADEEWRVRAAAADALLAAPARALRGFERVAGELYVLAHDSEVSAAWTAV